MRAQTATLLSPTISITLKKKSRKLSPFFGFQSLFYIGEQLFPDIEFGLTKETSKDDRASDSQDSFQALGIKRHLFHNLHDDH
jgi:hypothetical protein